MSANSEEEVKEIVKTESFDFQYTCGYNKVVSLSNREEFVKAICMHYVIYNVHTELTHLRNGLMQTLQMRKFAQDHAVELWSLLAISKEGNELTASQIQDLFVAVYSPKGSNARLEEERVMMFLCDFLQACEGNYSYGNNVLSNTKLYSADDHESVGVSLEDMMAFVTGESAIPAIGFDSTPKIFFTSEERLPEASTCSLSLTLPRCITTFEKFKDVMATSIIGCHGFGNV